MPRTVMGIELVPGERSAPSNYSRNTAKYASHVTKYVIYDIADA